MSQSERRISPDPLDDAQRVRGQFIDLTYALPKDAPAEVLRRWNVADAALLDFIGALEDIRALEEVRSHAGGLTKS